MNKGKKKGRDRFVLVLPSVARVPCKGSSLSDGGAYVLVEAEEVVGVVATLERLEPVILLCPVGLADPLLTLLHQEVYIDARVVGLKGRPEVSGPLPLLVEALRRLGDTPDVERMPGAASAESCLLLSHACDSPSELPDHKGRQRGVDLQRVIDRDVDNLVGELRDVAGPNVVPPPVRERRIEHRLVGEEGFGYAQIEHRRSELFERLHDLLPLLHRSCVAAHDTHDQLAVQLLGHEGKWWRLPVGHDRHELVRSLRYPLTVEA